MTRAKEGTGLGLALVKSLAAMHGGEAVLESALGEGTTVRGAPAVCGGGRGRQRRLKRSRPRSCRSAARPDPTSPCMTSAPRLKAGIFVRALIRRAEVAGASAFVVRKGAEEAGAVILPDRAAGWHLPGAQPGARRQGDLVWARPLGDWSEEAGAPPGSTSRSNSIPICGSWKSRTAQGRAFVDEPIV